MAVDAVLLVLAYYLALAFRFEGRIPPSLGLEGSFPIFIVLAIAVHIYVNWAARAYTIVNRYIGLRQALRIAEAAVASTFALMLFVASLSTAEHVTPLSVIPIGGLLAMVGMIGVRFYSRIFHERSLSNVQSENNMLIVGAGRSANAIVRELDQGQVPDTRAVGIVDDNPALKGMRLYDVPILGTLDAIARLVDERDVTDVLIALDNPEPEQVAYVHRICHELDVPVKTVPRIADIVGGQASVSYARKLRIEDFLGRPAVEIDLAAIAGYLKDKRVLVTGAAGSIGSELCRQISAFSPAEMVLVDKDESGLYYLREELAARGVEKCVIKPTSVALRTKMERLFAGYRPEIVFHAAAFKHVPLMELSPDEAVINNVRGTLVIAEAAAHHGAERVVYISSDKAVDPSCVMGATKRVGEYLMQLLSARHPHTRFCSVRFGNVLGSRGSVLPLFQQQIEAGGPVTVTHPDMERYFMTIPEAVRLVLQAAALAEEVPVSSTGIQGPFVLDMGAPVKIVDVAHKMILLLNGTNKDTFVIFTGLRPGEKLAEDLFCHDERALPTSHPMIRLAARDWQSSTNGALPSGFRGNLRHLISLAEQDAPATAIVEALQSCVPTYVPLVWTTGPQVDASRGSAPGTDELVGRLDTPDAVEAIRLSTPGRTLEIARSAAAHDV
jgi:FlaA1/EpsC-like NDP-sugar epimerase